MSTCPVLKSTLKVLSQPKNLFDINIVTQTCLTDFYINIKGFLATHCCTDLGSWVTRNLPCGKVGGVGDIIGTGDQAAWEHFAKLGVFAAHTEPAPL